MASLNSLRDELNRMVNWQFETPEFQRLLSVRFTLPRARFYIIHNAYYKPWDGSKEIPRTDLLIDVLKRRAETVDTFQNARLGLAQSYKCQF